MQGKEMKQKRKRKMNKQAKLVRDTQPAENLEEIVNYEEFDEG